MKHLLMTATLLMMTTMNYAEPVYYKGTETLPYRVIETLDENIEIREYPPAMAVKATNSRSNSAFRLLFKYISGDNKTNSSIAMTSPVETSSAKIAMTTPVEMTGDSEMLFFLPTEFNKESVPQPTHPDVSIMTVPARKIAAIKYSGRDNRKKRQEHTQSLSDALEKTDYTVVGSLSFLGYDSPWTLPWNRRNEIIVTLE